VNAETTLVPITPDIILAREMARFVGGPLGFVMYAYHWGKVGTENWSMRQARIPFKRSS
jgi:hypothetical protein